jgi:hypothetical protein
MCRPLKRLPRAASLLPARRPNLKRGTCALNTSLPGLAVVAVRTLAGRPGLAWDAIGRRAGGRVNSCKALAGTTPDTPWSVALWCAQVLAMEVVLRCVARIRPVAGGVEGAACVWLTRWLHTLIAWGGWVQQCFSRDHCCQKGGSCSRKGWPQGRVAVTGAALETQMRCAPGGDVVWRYNGKAAGANSAGLSGRQAWQGFVFL